MIKASCPDCYDYTAHIAFNWHAPELWRRFTITLRRNLRLTRSTSVALPVRGRACGEGRIPVSRGAPTLIMTSLIRSPTIRTLRH